MTVIVLVVTHRTAVPEVQGFLFPALTTNFILCVPFCLDGVTFLCSPEEIHIVVALTVRPYVHPPVRMFIRPSVCSFARPFTSCPGLTRYLKEVWIRHVEDRWISLSRISVHKNCYSAWPYLWVIINCSFLHFELVRDITLKLQVSTKTV